MSALSAIVHMPLMGKGLCVVAANHRHAGFAMKTVFAERTVNVMSIRVYKIAVIVMLHMVQISWQ